jgi:uncharacterized protein
MAYFVVYALDKPGRDSARAEFRPQHRARLREHDHPVAVKIGGPLLNDAGRMVGSMLVIEAETKADVEAFVAGDPYVAADVYASVAVHPFTWGLGNPDGAAGG